jgi:uncharacterized membrane protein YkoI
MKIKMISRSTLVIGVFAALSLPARADDDDKTVNWNDLPTAVQTTITANANGGTVGKVKKENENGATTYEAKVKNGEQKMEIEVAADGTLLETETKGLELSSLPAAVQTTINAKANGGKIGKIEEETEKGTTSYEATIKGADGQKIKIEVAADGTLTSVESKHEDEDKDGDHGDKDDDGDGK